MSGQNFDWNSSSGNEANEPLQRPSVPQSAFSSANRYPLNPTYLPNQVHDPYASVTQEQPKDGKIPPILIVLVAVVTLSLVGVIVWLLLSGGQPTSEDQPDASPTATPSAQQSPSESPGPANEQPRPNPPAGVVPTKVPDSLPKSVGGWVFISGVAPLYSNDDGQLINLSAFEMRDAELAALQIGIGEITEFPGGFCGVDNSFKAYQCYVAKDDLAIHLASTDAPNEQVKAVAEGIASTN